MTDLTITRFDRTASGYKRRDTTLVNHGPDFANLLNECVAMAANPQNKEPQAWSFSKFKAGKMSGETWVEASGIMLEYVLGKNPAGRVQEVMEAANKLGHGYYAMTTETRQGVPTITIVFPLSEPITEARYARMASVLATQMGLYNAVPGIQAYSHLVTINPETIVEYVGGLLINPDFFIKMTKNEAQHINPRQFERTCPKVAVHIDPPECTAAEPGLFQW